MVMSEQKKDLRNRFIKHLLGHRGSYTDLFEIELVQITEGIMVHLPPPHQLHHVPLKGYVILCNYWQRVNRKMISTKDDS